MSINNMTRATGPMVGADLLAGWPQSAQDNQVFTAAQVLAYVQANAAIPNTIFLAPQHANPVASGFTVSVQASATQPSTWLILSPTGTMATGTITLPANPVANQRLQVSTTQLITSLTIDGNGKGLVGAPTTLLAGGFLGLRFDVVTNLWYSVN